MKINNDVVMKMMMIMLFINILRVVPTGKPEAGAPATRAGDSPAAGAVVLRGMIIMHR